MPAGLLVCALLSLAATRPAPRHAPAQTVEPKASPPTTTTSASPTTSPATTVTPTLEVVEVLLAADDPEGALAALEAVEAKGGLSLEEVVQVWRLRGTARALVDDSTGAAASFVELLTLRPTSTLPADAPARAATAFLDAQAMMVTRPRLDLALQVPMGAPLDEPLHVEVVRRSDDRERVSEIVVWHRNKGASTWSQVVVPLVGERTSVTLPARSAREAILDDLGRSGAIVELALSGRDARGSTVFAAPSIDAPLEWLVGFDPPPPWYAQPLVWVGVGAGVAVVLGGAAAATIVATTPSTSLQLSATVAP